MKIYNQQRTEILSEYDLTKGYLKPDTIEVTTLEVQAVEEQFHYETIAEYPNGGKDVKKVVDVEGVEYQPAETKTENILVYIEYTAEELEEKELNELRARREKECFAYINRGQLWYATLTEVQLSELQTWYQSWLDVTETKTIPTKPTWLE